MNKRDLEKLSKAELIKMVKKLQKKAKKPKIVIVDDDYRPVPPPRTYKPIPAPSTNETIKKPYLNQARVSNKLVNEYEDLILPPSPQFRDGCKPVPAPRTNKTIEKGLTNHKSNQGAYLLEVQKTAFHLETSVRTHSTRELKGIKSH